MHDAVGNVCKAMDFVVRESGIMIRICDDVFWILLHCVLLLICFTIPVHFFMSTSLSIIRLFVHIGIIKNHLKLLILRTHPHPFLLRHMFVFLT